MFLIDYQKIRINLLVRIFCFIFVITKKKIMLTIKETIILNEFNPAKPGGEMIINTKNFGVPSIDVLMILDFMEDEMYAIISRKTTDVYSILPTDRGVLHFKQIFKNISK